MPFLQLELPQRYPADVKQRLARRMGDLYAQHMQTRPDAVRVAFRELTDGGLWRCSDGEPTPTAVLMCDIRRGRPPEQRAQLAEALIEACVEALALPTGMLVEFTQHSGDEMYRAGRGWAEDWTPAEAGAAAGGIRR